MNIATSNTGFFPFIHVLRGIAPIMVMWAHLVFFWLIDHNITTGFPNLEWFNYVVSPFHLYQNGGHLGVVIFFFVSGFVITHTSLGESKVQFLIKRFFRIFPVLLFAIIVTFFSRKTSFYLGLGNITGTSGANVMDFLRGFFLIDQIVGLSPPVLGVTWSLVTEIIFYSLTFSVIDSTRRDSVGATYIMLIIWVVFYLLCNSISYLRRVNEFSIYLPFLFCGRSFYLAESGRIKWVQCFSICFASLSLFVLYYTNQNPSQLTEKNNIYLPESGGTYLIGLSIFLSFMTYGIKKVSRSISFVADISMSLYLLHIPVGMLVINYLHHSGVIFIVCVGVAVIISFIVSYLSYSFIEKPCQAYARYIIKRYSL